MESKLDTLFYKETLYAADLGAACSETVEVGTDKLRLYCGGSNVDRSINHGSDNMPRSRKRSEENASQYGSDILHLMSSRSV